MKYDQLRPRCKHYGSIAAQLGSGLRSLVMPTPNAAVLGSLISILNSRDQRFIFSGLNEDAKSWIVEDSIEYCQNMDIKSRVCIYFLAQHKVCAVKIKSPHWQ